jgi:tetratricopeptide (TPR) repeat protein
MSVMAITTVQAQVPCLVPQVAMALLQSPGAMKPGSPLTPRPLLLVRLLALALGLSLAAAHADESGDINQLLRAGKIAEAQLRVERKLAASPRDPQMRFLKGVIQRDSGRLADATATFTKLTEDHPELPEPYNNLAVIYSSQGQYEKARTALEAALRTNPSYATAHENLADIYAKLASQAYNKALQIDGSNSTVQPKLALIRELFSPASSGPKPVPVSPVPVHATAPPPAPVVAAAVPVKPAAPVPAVQTPAKPGVAAPAPQAPAGVAVVAAAPKATPTVPTPSVSTDAAIREVETAVQAWAKAWSDKNMVAYLGAYGSEFEPPARQPRSAWEQDRRLRITGKTRISVNLLNLTVTANGSRAVAKFRQDYKADSLAVLSRKTLELVKSGNRWLIVKETSGS